MIRLGLMISFVCFVLTAAFSAIGWLGTPEGAQVPTQIGLSGEVGSYGSKMEAFLFLPAILAGVTFLLSIAPAVDPRGRNVRRSRSLYLVAWTIGMVAIAGSQGFTTWMALGGEVQPELFTRALAIFLAAIMLLLGLVIAKARPNFFAGFRTPWTLSSDLSWDKTHRWASRLFLAAGLVGLPAAILLPASSVLPVLLAVMILKSLGLAVYSWWVWKHDPARETLAPDEAD